MLSVAHCLKSAVSYIFQVLFIYLFLVPVTQSWLVVEVPYHWF